MNRFKLILLFLCLYSKNSFSADTLKFKTFGTEYDNEAKDIIHCQDNGYLIVGSTYVSEAKKSDVYLLKLDANFEKEWSFAYGGTNIDGANSVIQLNNGRFLIAGYSNSFNNGGYDIYLICTDENGQFIWEKTIGGDDWDFAHDLILTYDNKILLCGETYSYGNGNADAYLIKIDENADTLFTRTYGFTGKDAAYELIQSHDSLVYICGETYVGATDSTNILFWTLDQNHNNNIVTNIGGTRTDIANDIIETSDHNLLIAGETGSLSNRSDVNQYLVKINPVGQILWDLEGGNAASGNLDDSYGSVAQNNLNLYLAGGYTNTYGYLNSQDISMSCFDQNGNFRRGNNIGQNEDEWIEKIIAVNDKFVLVGNIQSFTNGNTDVFVGYGIDDMMTDSSYINLGSVKDTFIISVPNIGYEVNISVYPNPAENFITVHNTSNESTAVIIQNAMGQIMKTVSLFQTDNIDISYLPIGIYTMSILGRNKRIDKKFIKQ